MEINNDLWRRIGKYCYDRNLDKKKTVENLIEKFLEDANSEDCEEIKFSLKVY